MKESWIDTPLGPMLAVAGEAALHFLDWDEGRRLAMGRKRLAAWGEIAAGETAVHRALRRRLAAYFAGTSAAFDLPLSQPGPAFRQSVWQALRTIPAGRTETYAGLARRLGRPEAARAVGAANGANLISILVPCHRLTGSGGSLTGYGGGLHRKDWLLRHEAEAFGQHSP
ncbi:methylated-DNA--[protein]-cysteine S-methyltransferase [Rhodobacter sp. SGA-6-6]|uniref:methylated-DNA--[protein]-cysteine S-methyltransferase n=1 Tax=Rhodobacter sp. SGA-6-6 TaxID=2710882 RepID=UPI0013ED3D86|nr:methylated-DNA--[protein]-cysteine S-methyltransferase [Rhodobacter sp. SGA-6-6]